MARLSDVNVNLLIVLLCGVFVVILLFKDRIIVPSTTEVQEKREVVNKLPPNIKSSNNLWRKPAEVNWEKILQFIPDKKNEDCLQLFTTGESAKIKDSSEPFKKYHEFMELVKAESNRLKDHKHTPAPAHEKLTLTYQALAKEPWVKTVCEIGFDQGQSALAWLTAKPDLTLHSFDIGILGKTPYMAKLVKTHFKDRFQFHLGSSEMIMPLWSILMKEQCDIVSIDGGHEFPQVLPDFTHMRKMAARKHMIIADDIEYPGVKQTWTLLKDLGVVTEQYRCHIAGIDIDFVIGQYGEFFWET